MVSLLFPRSPALSPSAERLLLQLVIIAGGFVPVGFGLAGAVLGAALTGGVGSDVGDSQLRFLSGLSVGIGLAYWEAVPQIEVRTARIRLLTMVVLFGGLFRLIGVVFIDSIDRTMAFCLAMELVVTPLVYLWQLRIARRFGSLR